MATDTERFIDNAPSDVIYMYHHAKKTRKREDVCILLLHRFLTDERMSELWHKLSSLNIDSGSFALAADRAFFGHRDQETMRPTKDRHAWLKKIGIDAIRLSDEISGTRFDKMPYRLTASYFESAPEPGTDWINKMEEGSELMKLIF